LPGRDHFKSFVCTQERDLYPPLHISDWPTVHMKTGALLARTLSIAILLFAFGVSVYRAKTQTIAHDEALTYEWFLDQGVYDVLRYNPANHVLQTLLAKPLVKVFGVSEFTLRVPSLLGAAIYLLAVYLLCRKLFGEGLLLVLSTAMLALNPLVMDFMPAARGYSLGLAGLAVAMYAFATMAELGKFDPDDSEWRWGCAAASMALALAVTANFTNIVPATCLAFSFTLVALGGFAPIFGFRDRALREFAKYFILPGAAVGFCILWPYLLQARVVQTKIQLDTASDALRDIFNASFLYKWTEDLFNSLGAVPSAPGSWQERATALGAFFLLPLLFAFVLTGLVLALRAPADSKQRQRAQCRIFAGAATGSVILTVVLHFATKVNYPYSRYCMFVVPLFTIAGVLAAREISSRFPWMFLRLAGVFLAAIVVFDYGLAFNTKSFRYNAYDVISRDLYQSIEKDALSRGVSTVHVGGTWWYEGEINFYRLQHRAKWMLPYEIQDRSYWWKTPGALEPSAYDYFVFIPACDPHLTGPRVRTIFHDEKTKATVIALARE
jgi:4-amino-4-deoxy-L-arabinose transferase-like glycosyltransferase